MKILRVRLQNLNSLRGEHTVDFDAEPLRSAGIFAITGPTGAGKTTLLDAITLALFGRSARYGSKPSPEDVMSRQTGACSAEVEFEVPGQGRFRARWSLNRARGKADGRVQAARRAVYDAEGGVLADKIGDADQKIADLIGLDHDRFLRSVLLAQGDFARFLKSGDDERATLLESLTGTEIYSALGARAFEESKRRRDELDRKSAALENLTTLGEEDRRALEEQIRADADRQSVLKAELEKGGALLGRIDRLARARADHVGAQKEAGAIAEAKQAASADLARLDADDLTQPFREDLAALVGARSADAEAQRALLAAREKEQEAEKAAAAAGALLAASFDAAAGAAQAEVSSGEAEAKKAGEAEAAARAWTEEHRSDERIASGMVEIATGLTDLRASRERLTRDWGDWLRRARALMGEGNDIAAVDAESLSPDELAARSDEAIGAATAREAGLAEAEEKARQEATLREDHRKKAMLLASLESHREKLVEGEACPLCGALDHPYATGGTGPAEDEIERAADAAAAAHKAAQSALQKHRDGLVALERDRGNVIEARSSLATKLAEVGAVLESVGESVPGTGEEDEARRALGERADRWKKQSEALAAASQAVLAATTRVQRARERFEEIDRKRAERGDLPEAAVPGGGEVPALDRAEKQYETASASMVEARTTAKVKEADAAGAAEKLASAESGLGTAIAGSSFGSIADLEEARLSNAEATRIRALREGLKEREQRCQAMLEQAHKVAGELRADDTPEGEEAEVFRSSHAAREKERDELGEGLGERNERLRQDEDARKKKAEMGAALEQERAAAAVWRQLADLVGSADGSKFRRIAQRLSLDILTRRANRHLMRLSDRYLIRRVDGEKGEGLSLEIEDLHQAGVRRPMESLSGGESFLASLALALGLSDLAGRNVRIDSLFIDEGFGTLDPETLEVAIAALESLQENDKTIGVISHVELLKERIGTQIVVEKQSGGTSRVFTVPSAATGATG